MNHFEKPYQPSGKRVWDIALSLLITGLVGLCAWQSYYFGPVIVDGFQSAGAYAKSVYPLDLHWPFMDGFAGFDHEWGFHWPGWPALRSCLNWLLPWNPASELVLLGCIWGAMAFFVARKAAQFIGSAWMSLPIALGLMTGPRFLIGSLSYRPEIFGALLFVIFVANWVALSDAKSRRSALILCCVSSFALPLVIPEGVAVIAGFLLCWGLANRWLQGRLTSWRAIGFVGLAYVGGCAALVGHFLIPEYTALHLQENLLAQAEIPKGVANTLRLAILSKSDLGAWPLWLIGYALAFTSLLLWVLRFRSSEQAPVAERDRYLWVSALMALGILGVTLVTSNVNGLRLMMLSPWLILLVAAGGRALMSWPPLRGRVPMALWNIAFIALFAAPSLFFWLRWSEWPNLEGVALRDRASDCLQALPDARVTYIPVGLWEAAVRDPRDREYRFATFPNLAMQDYRREYEQHVYRDLQPGDLLVFDVTDDEGGGPFPNATRARMQILNQDLRDWSRWELLNEVRYQVGDSKAFQRHWKIFKRKE